MRNERDKEIDRVIARERERLRIEDELEEREEGLDLDTWRLPLRLGVTQLTAVDEEKERMRVPLTTFWRLLENDHPFVLTYKKK